ncbi:MAG TPA: cytochrome c [Pseudomonadaceae bacterium]|nr:cytochrome c [Pseudomonadaceae bacterium]
MSRILLVASLLLTSTVMAQDDARQTRGKEVYEHWCTPCHGPNPRKHPGTSALQLLYRGERPAVLEERDDLTPEIVAFYVRNGVSIMPFFRKTEISDEDLAAMGAYLTPD